MEPNRPVHAPWVELSKEEDIKWHPKGADIYTGSAGGGIAGPTSRMKETARNDAEKLNASGHKEH